MRVASRRQFAPKSRLQIAPKLMLRFAAVVVVGLEIVAEVRFEKHTFAIFENHTQSLVVLHCTALLLLLLCARLCILLLLEQWSEWKALQALCVVSQSGWRLGVLRLPVVYLSQRVRRFYPKSVSPSSWRVFANWNARQSIYRPSRWWCWCLCRDRCIDIYTQIQMPGQPQPQTTYRWVWLGLRTVYSAALRWRVALFKGAHSFFVYFIHTVFMARWKFQSNSISLKLYCSGIKKS